MVEEVSQSGKEVPSSFIWTDTVGFGALNLTLPWATHIPTIDFQKLSSSDHEELGNLRAALSSWGCFQAINHGIEDGVLEKIDQLTKEFFHLPKEEKQKYARPEDDYEGYGMDLVASDHRSLDWTDRLILLVRPHNRQNLKYWPQKPNHFREILNEYTDGVKHVQDVLLKSMAMSLGIDEDCFVKEFGEECTMHARFSNYPPCSRPDLVMGLKPHTDGSGLTILLQDRHVHGLHVLKDGQWLQVPIVPNALLINVGDQMEIISNGMFKSIVHRVVTNSESERSTLAIFFNPDASKEIGPLNELVDDERPRVFNRVTDYQSAFFQFSQQGKMPIDVLRIKP